ncbi:MAG: helix-turn-helix domain-containing protein [Candidatus Diapherotrites archaeon]
MSELISLLKRTGLNEYESKTYSALLGLNTATASEISSEAGIPRARVYDVLVGLKNKGFVVFSIGRPLKFKALNPDAALNNFSELRKKNFESELEDLSRIKELIGKSAMERKGKGKELGSAGVWLLHGRRNIYGAIGNALSSASESVIISTSEANALKKIEAFKHKFKSLKRKGVNVELSSNLCSPKGKELSAKAKDLVALKHSVKHNRFMVFDGRKVLLFLHEKPEEGLEEKEKALLIESPSIARLVCPIK